MNKSKSLKIVLLVLMIATVALTAAACDASALLNSSNPLPSYIQKLDGVKEYYLVNEAINYDEIKVWVMYSNGQPAEIALSDTAYTPADTSAAGSSEITITYKGVTGKFTVSVKTRDSVAQLSVPGSVKASGSKLLWSAVPNAGSYVVSIKYDQNEAQEFETSDLTYDFSNQIIGDGTLSISVKAKAAASSVYVDSTFSEAVTVKGIIKLDTPANLSLNGTTLSWGVVSRDNVGSIYYIVKQDDGTAATVTTTTFDISTLNLGARDASYKFTVIAAASKAGVIQSSPTNTVEYGVKRLETPKLTINGRRLEWNYVTGAFSYKLMSGANESGKETEVGGSLSPNVLHYDLGYKVDVNGAYVYDPTLKKYVPYTVDYTGFERLSIDTAYHKEGSYDFRLVAVGDGLRVLNSYVSEKATFSIYKLASPTNLYVDDAEALKWANVAGDVKSYSVYKKVGEEYVLLKGNIIDENVSGVQHYLSYKVSEVGQTGTYDFAVKAIGDGDTVLDSDFSNIARYQYILPLNRPMGVSFVSVGSSKLKWDSVQNAGGYEIYTENGLVYTTTGTLIDCSTIPGLGYGIFTFRVRAIPAVGNTNFRASGFTTAGSSYTSVFNFSDLGVTIDENNVASWNAMEYADYYQVYVYGKSISLTEPVTGLITYEDNIIVNATTFDLKTLRKGYYSNITILAKSNSSTIYKDTSSPINLVARYGAGGVMVLKDTLATPQISVSESGLVSWDSINLAKSYTVNFYLSNDNIITYSGEDIVGSSCQLTGLESITSGTYKIEVIATTIAALKDYLTNNASTSSASVQFAIGKLATPKLSIGYITKEIDGTSSRTISWAAVNGASGYKLYYSVKGDAEVFEIGQVDANVLKYTIKQTEISALFDAGSYVICVEALGNNGNRITSERGEIAHEISALEKLPTPSSDPDAFFIRYGVFYWLPVEGADSYILTYSVGAYKLLSQCINDGDTVPENPIYYYNDNGEYVVWVDGVHDKSDKMVYVYLGGSSIDVKQNNTLFYKKIDGVTYAYADNNLRAKTDYKVTLSAISYELNTTGQESIIKQSDPNDGLTFNMESEPPYGELVYSTGEVKTSASGVCKYTILVTNGNENVAFTFDVTYELFSKYPNEQRFNLFANYDLLPSGNLKVYTIMQGKNGTIDSRMYLSGSFIKLAAPTVGLSTFTYNDNTYGDTIKWSSVSGATNYMVVIEGKTYTLESHPDLYSETGNSCYLNPAYVTLSSGVINVYAISNAYMTSQSNAGVYQYSKLSVPDVVYAAGELSWTERANLTYIAEFVDPNDPTVITILGKGTGTLRIKVPETRELSDYQITAVLKSPANANNGSMKSATWSQVLSDVSDFKYGLGTIGSPYLIEEPAQFAKIANYSGKYFKLALNLTNGSINNFALENWTPFVFNTGNVLFGNGMKIEYSITNTNQNYQNSSGLFTTNKGTIQDLTVSANIVSTDDNGLGIAANINAGGVATFNQGVIDNVTVLGRVEATLNAGGIAATNYGTIKNCGNKAVVKASGVNRGAQSVAGGVAATNSAGTIEWSYSITDLFANLYYHDGKDKYNLTNQVIAYSNTHYAIAGGVVGYGTGSQSVINANYSYSHVYANATGGKAAYAGGFAGWIKMGVNVSNCLSTGNVLSETVRSIAVAGGFCGSASGLISYSYCIGEVKAVTNTDEGGSATARGFLADKVGSSPIVCYFILDASGTGITLEYEKNLAVSTAELKNPNPQLVASTKGQYVLIDGSKVLYDAANPAHAGLQRYNWVGDLYSEGDYTNNAIWDINTINTAYQFPHLVGEKFLVKIEDNPDSITKLKNIEYATKLEGGTGDNSTRLDISQSNIIKRYYTTLYITNNDWVYNISANIDYNSLNGGVLAPIAKFMGTAYGNGISIKNFELLASDIGLYSVIIKNFGKLYELNVRDFNVEISSSNADYGDIVLGGLVSYNYGIIGGCSASGGSIRASSLKGAAIVGGLVGINAGIITNGTSMSVISQADVDVYGRSVTGKNTLIGGLVGFNNGGYIYNAYAAGAVETYSNNYEKGGLVGKNVKPTDYFGDPLNNIFGCTYSVSTGCSIADNEWGDRV